MKKYLSIVIVAVFALAACKKNKDHITYLIPGIKENYFFKKGSYWIYKDSISGRIDSCYLNASYNGIDDSRTIPWPYEFMYFFLTQNPIDTSIKKQINWHLIFKGGNEISGYYFNVDLDVHSIFKGYYPLTIDNQKSNPIMVEQISNFSIGGNTFGTVSMVTYDNQIFYLKEGIGYVKARINYKKDSVKINEVWELQRWHIIK